MPLRRISPKHFTLATCALLLSLLLPHLAHAQIKDIIQPVGIIQYNVKNHQGAWISDAPGAIIKLQIQLIAYQVKQRAKANPPVDFIALEQSELKGKNADGDMVDGNIANLLSNEGLPGWIMIQSQCEFDITQLAYSPDWELVKAPGIQNPLVNSTGSGAPQNGWVRGGCTKGNGRPYNIAFFNNKKTSVKVLFVITHMPHCHGGDFTACAKSWRIRELKDDIARAVGKTAKLTRVHFVMAGDMNEFGASDDGKTLAPIFPYFGPLQISTNLATCCADSNYTNRFDRLLANSPTRPKADILTRISDTKEITYPLDPNFSVRANEEHKAIFGVVEFVPPGRK